LTGVAVDAVFEAFLWQQFKDKLNEMGIIFCLFRCCSKSSELVKNIWKCSSLQIIFAAALNSAVFSDGSFVHTKKVKMPRLSTYSVINAATLVSLKNINRC
jgi:hypothetical protein